MGKHSARDSKTGRFTPSGAPIPGNDGQGDTSAYEHVVSPSADPQAEHDRVAGYPEFRESYPVHDFAHQGPVQRSLPHRRQVVVDAQTGQELDARITNVPGAEQYVSPKTQAHLAAAEGDPFASNLMGPAIGPETRSYRRTPGTGGYKLPAMGQSDRDAEWKGGR